MSEWIEFPKDPSNELLKSINEENQVLAYEAGRYFNAWLEFDVYEGGYVWMDDADTEPDPSHYMVLPPKPNQ